MKFCTNETVRKTRQVVRKFKATIPSASNFISHEHQRYAKRINFDLLPFFFLFCLRRYWISIVHVYVCVCVGAFFHFHPIHFLLFNLVFLSPLFHLIHRRQNAEMDEIFKLTMPTLMVFNLTKINFAKNFIC